jgi:hypothetical protein
MSGGYESGNGEASAGDDILEQGSSRPPVRWWPPVRLRRPAAVAVVLGVAGLLTGLAAGYAAGTLHTGKRTPPPAQSAAATPLTIFAGFPVGQSGPQCSAQAGDQLQLGVQVTNVSAAPAVLRRVDVVLPLGGLKMISQAWGPCSQLSVTLFGVPGELDRVLPAGASTWFTVTFQVLVRCPGPLPVQFTLSYNQNGRPASVQLPGFNDLGQVPYTGCQ